jgi:hypothetical protein
LLLLDGQVHHDTHVIPMGNYVIGAGNYVIVSPSELGNYVSADTGRFNTIPTRPQPPWLTLMTRTRPPGRTTSLSAARPSRPALQLYAYDHLVKDRQDELISAAVRSHLAARARRARRPAATT